MATEIKTDWKTSYINGIESNGVECWWTLAESDGLRRFYKIVPYYKCDVNGVSLEENPHYFAFYEATRYVTIDDGNDERNRCSLNYDGIIPENAILIAIYEDLKTAMARVETQFRAIAYAKSFCER